MPAMSWPPCGDSYFETKSSPSYIAQTIRVAHVCSLFLRFGPGAIARRCLLRPGHNTRRPGHNTRPSAPPERAASLTAEDSSQPRFPDSWPLRAVGQACSNDGRRGTTVTEELGAMPEVEQFSDNDAAGAWTIAKVPGRPNKACFPKEDFQNSTMESPMSTGLLPRLPLTVLDGNFQRSEGFAEYRRLRQAAEHRLARLVQLGVRQSRYFGRAKTRFQLLMAATVANLTLVATKMGMISPAPGSSHDKPDQQAPGSPIVTTQFILAAANWVTLSLTYSPLASTPSRHSGLFSRVSRRGRTSPCQRCLRVAHVWSAGQGQPAGVSCVPVITLGVPVITLGPPLHPSHGFLTVGRCGPWARHAPMTPAGNHRH